MLGSLAGFFHAHEARACVTSVSVLALDGGLSSGDKVPGNFQLRAGLMHRFGCPSFVDLGGDLSLRLGHGGARIAPLTRVSLDWKGLYTAFELGPSLRLGPSLAPGGMAQVTVGVAFLPQVSLWAEQTTQSRAAGVMLGIDLGQIASVFARSVQ